MSHSTQADRDAEGQGASREEHPVILFDGVCNLCNAAVQWVIGRDRDALFRLASLQSEASRRVLEEVRPRVEVADLPDSIVLVDQDGIHTRSTAAMRIARRLGFPSSLLTMGYVLPASIRDAVYDFVARNRYGWFGRRDRCMMPTPETAARFLDADEDR
jgi:predicted DCC family thiol-disulfide oxidoreductase YuxK